MRSLKALAIFLISLFHQSICQNIVQIYKDLSLTVQGECGLFVISVNYTINGNQATDTVTAKLNSLVEKDSNGIAIEDLNHTFTDFCGLNFTTVEYSQNLWNNTNFVIQSSANITSRASAAITVYAVLFTVDGIIETGANETVQFKPGYVKFAYEIDNWPFCTNSLENCQGINCCLQGNGTQIGAYLDLSFEVQGNQNATSQDNLTYDLGNSDLILSRFALTDNDDTPQLMPNDPLFQSQGNSNSSVFTVRLPAFNSMGVYDPFVSMKNIDRSNSSRYTGLIIGIIAVIIALLLAFFVFRYFRRSKIQENLIA